MKLQDLASLSKTKHSAKVMESYFNKSLNFDAISPSQARGMLQKVRGLIEEQSQRRELGSEQDPAYLKLMVMEQGLVGRLQQYSAAMHNPRTLRESEIQQAQVVLAAQDIVDQMQKMIEQVSSLQFKDLPALVEQIKNEIGVDQSMQFNQSATGALAGLVDNLQQSKQQMEAAVGVITGQTPAGAGMNPDEMAGITAGEVPDGAATGEAPVEAPDMAAPPGALGRAKR